MTVIQAATGISAQFRSVYSSTAVPLGMTPKRELVRVP
jgi:hypothetical protein